MKCNAATRAGKARAESSAGKTLAELYLIGVFAMSIRKSTCFYSDKEIEAEPGE